MVKFCIRTKEGCEWIIKRYNNLYENIYKIENIISAYNEVCKNTQSKKKVYRFKEYKSIYIARIYETLKNREYVPGPYNKFVIYEPKRRNIVSQGMFDKTVNHIVSRHILYPAILPCLLDINVASRFELGIKAGLGFYNQFQGKCKIKYDKYYILKCDISKFFASIDHNILKEKIKRRIKDKDALQIVFDIIDSEDMPCGLGIGNMTSQIFAIFYLNDFDHFIREELKISYYTRYQDDFLLFHPSKEYLKYCLKEIEIFLVKENLKLNKKTRIYKNTDNYIYLGRNSEGKYAKYRTVNRRIKRKNRLYEEGLITLSSYNSSLMSYDFIAKRQKKNLEKEENRYVC